MNQPIDEKSAKTGATPTEPPPSPATESLEPIIKKREDGKYEYRIQGKPVQAYGEDTKVLVFSEPSGADIESAGMPVKWQVKVTADYMEMSPDIDERKMAAMFSRLAGIPVSSVRKLDARDWASLAGVLANFFIPHPGTLI